MKAVGRYDAELQMFVEDRREPDLRRLNFLRWMVENGRIGRREGPASGEQAVRALVVNAEREASTQNSSIETAQKGRGPDGGAPGMSRR